VGHNRGIIVKSFGVTLVADDYGLTPAVSAGILEALSARRLSATSVMTTRPNWRKAAPALRPFDGHAEIGLHLDLTLGPPIGRMRSFAPSGSFPRIGEVLQRSIRRNIDRDEIREEIGRQLDAFEAEYGRAPDYLDGHQHVHLLPCIRDAVLDELEDRDLAGRLWLRDSADSAARILARASEIRKAFTVASFGAGFAKAARARGFSLNAGFSGFSDFNPERDYSRAFSRYLRAPGSRHLIMCHPGRVDLELERIDPATRSREAELAFLLSDDFPDMLQARGAHLQRLPMA
jgi:predicted glycoside hydrolase/deacetylase ChbG (UPF0249 family)